MGDNSRIVSLPTEFFINSAKMKTFYGPLHIFFLILAIDFCHRLFFIAESLPSLTRNYLF
jgi:hypothetical protein